MKHYTIVQIASSEAGVTKWGISVPYLMILVSELIIAPFSRQSDKRLPVQCIHDLKHI